MDETTDEQRPARGRVVRVALVAAIVGIIIGAVATAIPFEVSFKNARAS